MESSTTDEKSPTTRKKIPMSAQQNKNKVKAPIVFTDQTPPEDTTTTLKNNSPKKSPLKPKVKRVTIESNTTESNSTKQEKQLVSKPLSTRNTSSSPKKKESRKVLKTGQLQYKRGDKWFQSTANLLDNNVFRLVDSQSSKVGLFFFFATFVFTNIQQPLFSFLN